MAGAGTGVDWSCGVGITNEELNKLPAATLVAAKRTTKREVESEN